MRRRVLAICGLLATASAGCLVVTDFGPLGGGSGGGGGASPSSSSDASSSSTGGGGLLGEACALATDCASGFCSTGKCCNTACEGECGVCDESGHCTPAGAGTACTEAACVGGLLTLAGTCDGAGACVEAAPVSCGGFACDAAGAACLTTCADNQDCVRPATCNGASSCQVGMSSIGMACAGTCPDGAPCVDGFCCNAPCTDVCHACSNALTGAANGQCAPVTSMTDPSDECDATLPETCGTTGACVNGACEFWAMGTACGGNACIVKKITEDQCNGAGACTAVVVGQCPSNFICCDESGPCAPPSSCG